MTSTSFSPTSLEHSGENGKSRQMMAISSSDHHRHHHRNHNFVPLEDVVISKIATDGARAGGSDGSAENDESVIYVKHHFHQQEEYRI